MSLLPGLFSAVHVKVPAWLELHGVTGHVGALLHVEVQVREMKECVACSLQSIMGCAVGRAHVHPTYT